MLVFENTLPICASVDFNDSQGHSLIFQKPFSQDTCHSYGAHVIGNVNVVSESKQTWAEARCQSPELHLQHDGDAYRRERVLCCVLNGSAGGWVVWRTTCNVSGYYYWCFDFLLLSDCMKVSPCSYDQPPVKRRHQALYWETLKQICNVEKRKHLNTCSNSWAKTKFVPFSYTLQVKDASLGPNHKDDIGQARIS